MFNRLLILTLGAYLVYGVPVFAGPVKNGRPKSVDVQDCITALSFGPKRNEKKDNVHSEAFYKIVEVAKQGFPAWNKEAELREGVSRRTIWLGKYGDLSTLSPEEKRTLLRKFRQDDPSLSKVPLILRIALNPKDAEAWLEIFEFSTDQETFMDQTVRDLSPQIDQLPERIKTQILKRIAEKYPAVKKTPKNFYMQAPKRALDVWIRMLLPVDDIFLPVLKKTKSPIQAYQAYLDMIYARIIKKMPENNVLYGLLTANDILDLAREARQSLLDSGYEGEEPRIAFHGSVMKGLSKRGSDLDTLTLGLTTTRYGVQPQQEFMRPREGNLTIPNTPASRMVKKSELDFPDLGLIFSEPHEFRSYDNEKRGTGYYRIEIQKMSILEPFLIEITPQGVSLLFISSRDENGIFRQLDIDCDVGLNCTRYKLE